MKNHLFDAAGPAFEELSLEEMSTITGSGDVQPETTVPCIKTIVEIAKTSSSFCAGAGAGIGTGVTIVLSIKKC
ncbi:mersacidin family lantibiotic [Paenibacillus apiarius]|nr:mersacidin family lantibiotic [Paenibacillus apiarius]MEC0119459.1 mersacidin family lantibiotic [Paenibacillus apiarius]MEC0190871.1 mersacidin family lantibiotic [Paenibacillus apiarius]